MRRGQDEELNQNQEMGCLLSVALHHPGPDMEKMIDVKTERAPGEEYKIQNIWVLISQANCILLLFLLRVSVGHDWGEFARTDRTI